MLLHSIQWFDMHDKFDYMIRRLQCKRATMFVVILNEDLSLDRSLQFYKFIEEITIGHYYMIIQNRDHLKEKQKYFCEDLNYILRQKYGPYNIFVNYRKVVDHYRIVIVSDLDKVDIYIILQRMPNVYELFGYEGHLQIEIIE